MIIFYPNKNEMWGDDFDFSGDITLTPKLTTDHKVFRSRNEMCSYIRQKCANVMALVELNKHTHPVYGDGFNVDVNGIMVGWAKDDYR